MIKKAITGKTKFNINESVEGETIEQKINRVINNGEPIDDSAPIIYQERKEGIRPEFDIRTDRFDIAIDAMDAVSKSKVAKRIDFHTKKEEKKAPGGASTQATE